VRRGARTFVKGAACALVPALPAGCGGNVPVSHEVVMRGLAFEPASLEAAVGDTIVWVNRDVVPHTATSDYLDTGNVGAGEDRFVVLDRKGVVEYVCAYHPTMKGTVDVR